MVAEANWPYIAPHVDAVELRDMITMLARDKAERKAVGAHNQAKAQATFDEDAMIALRCAIRRRDWPARHFRLNRESIRVTAARRYKRRQFHLEVCVFKGVKPIIYNGREVWPLIEGGKGVSATNHASAGAWAAAGGIGTVSAVNADSYDPDGKIIPQVYKALTRRERHEELIDFAVEGAVQQVQRAHEIADGKGAININVLRSEEHTSELQSLMRISYAVFCLTKKQDKHKYQTE